MRVTCQKCSAAYAIDDKLVTPKGVRAQCPKCRHLQTVKNEPVGALAPSPLAEVAAAVPAPAPAQPRPGPARTAAVPAPAAKSPFDAFGDLGSPALPQNAEAADYSFDFDSLGPPTGLHPSPPSQAAPGSSSGRSADALGASVAPPGPTALNPIADASGREMLDFGDFDLGGGVSTSPGAAIGGGQPLGLAIPKANIATEPSVPSPSQLAQCRACGKPLDDPFDQALGTCEDCRSRSPDAATSSLGGAPSGPAISASIAPSGEVPALQDQGDSQEMDLAAAPEPATVAFRPSAPVRQANRTRTSASFEFPVPNRKFLVGAVLTVLAVGGIVGLIIVKRPWVRKPPPLAARVPATVSRPIDVMVAQWKQALPEVSGSAAEYLAAGEEQLAKDTFRGYQDAELAFQKALVLDRSSDRAVAGWALALAFGRGADVEPTLLDSAEQMLTAAAQRSGDSKVYVAHAHLLLVRGGNLNDVQALAERAKTSPSAKDKALAYLALGQAYVSKNPQFADENIKTAIELDPKLKRAALVQARFLLTLGRYKEAIVLLEDRLKADADQFEAAETLATIYVDVGELTLAKRALDRVRNADPRLFRPKLSLAIFAYQHGGNVGGAIEQLDGLLKDKAKLARKEVAEVMLHLSAAERINGDAEAAIDTAGEALKIFPDDAALRFHQLAALISGGKPGPAREALNGLRGKLPDVAVEMIFEGRIAWLEGKYMDAYTAFKSALEKDARHTDALLLAAAAAAKANRETQSYELVLKKGLHADPLQVAPALTMSRFFTSTAEILLPAKGAFMGLRKDPLDPNPLLAEGVLAFHLGQFAEADKIFSQVLAADIANAAAYAFRSLIALRNNDMGAALKLAQRATDAERLQAQGQLALGLVLWAQGKVEPAHKALKLAQEQRPNLLWGRVRLAELELRLKKPDEARRLLAAVLLSDNSYREAKRALYKAGL